MIQSLVGTFLKKRPLSLSIGAAIISLTQAAIAQQSIEEIVITGQGGVGAIRLDVENGAGSRLGLSSFDLPASVDIISREEIATKGDYGALEAVTRSAGISSSASPGNGGTSISSRGFNGHGSSVYTYDGTRLYIVAGTVTFPADTWTLDRVEVLRGAGSVINGIGALGTTINYVPKKPVFGDSEFAGNVAAGAGKLAAKGAIGAAQTAGDVAGSAVARDRVFAVNASETVELAARAIEVALTTNAPPVP